MTERYRVCFVCTGNICRSPMAEAVFRSHAREAGVEVDVSSAGTGGWHVGEDADPRTLAVLESSGYSLDHQARQFGADWFQDHDLVVALDLGHLRELRRMAPTPADAERVRLLREFEAAPSEDDCEVPDPYYGGQEGFEECLAMIEGAVPGLLEEVRRRLVESA
ncbi:low molecular weight protein-tyrosine-phosphatase [Streptomyces sp. NPDC005438]|uniref:low molecular weight protein-tyrosine-phosphatase n=1 Tax=Streptomyces sp. NPDC005438 TaxID=3156880 RepID=UPI0033BF2F6A